MELHKSHASYIRKDLSKQKFGRLTVINYSHTIKTEYSRGKAFWLCKCDCGNTLTVPTDKLKSGHTKSCGCFHKERITTHGESKTYFFRRWHLVKQRALKDKRYIKWGICKRWLKYENFKEDMYPSYVKHIEKYGIKNTTIDRKDGNKGYSKSNCRWATMKEQNNNFRRNYKIIYKNKIYTVSELYEKLNPKVNRACFSRRIVVYGWTIERSLIDYVYKKCYNM